jgi:putative transcriptional regulator
MVEILRNKNMTTRFQILVEIAAKQPNIQQRHIAKTLNITPQAVSDYIKQLLRERLLTTDGRSRYRVTNEGVDWILKQLKVTGAIADGDLSRGQTVGLIMREGLLVATPDLSVRATGVTVSDAASGNDVGIINVQGIISLEIGKVTVIAVPNMQKGGSKNVNLNRLQRVIRDKKPIAAVGVEALTTLKRVGIQPDYSYGAREAVIEAASSGLSPAIVCNDEEIPMLIKRLDEAGIKHKLLDLRASRKES